MAASVFVHEVMQKPNIISADLDGTIALIEHHRHWLDAERHPDMTSDERWRKFFAKCANDQPNWPVIDTLPGYLSAL